MRQRESARGQKRSRSLRRAAVEEARVEADVADVVARQQPAQEALEAEPVATVRHCAELALVRVPVVRRRVDALALVSWS